MRILFLTLMMSFLSHSAFGAFEGGGAGAADAIPDLVGLLRDHEPQVRETAAGALLNLAVNADNQVTIANEVSTHDDQELIISNLSSLVAENGWVQSLLDLIDP